jgi:hypothetical protein
MFQFQVAQIKTEINEIYIWFGNDQEIGTNESEAIQVLKLDLPCAAAAPVRHPPSSPYTDL